MRIGGGLGGGLGIGPESGLADDGKRLELSEFALDVSFKCRRQRYLRNLSISLLGGESEGGRIMADWVPNQAGGFHSRTSK